jgi:hypothetical protein
VMNNAVEGGLAVRNSAASAGVVRLVGKWISTGSTGTGSGGAQGRPGVGGRRRCARGADGADLADG